MPARRKYIEKSKRNEANEKIIISELRREPLKQLDTALFERLAVRLGRLECGSWKLANCWCKSVSELLA